MTTLDTETLARLIAEEKQAHRRTLLQLLSVLMGPLVICLLFAGMLIVSDLRDAGSAEGRLDALTFTRSALNVVANLQRERGLSNGHVASNGANFVNELDAQRAETDAVLSEELPKILAVATALRLEESPAMRARLDRLRDAVGALAGARVSISALEMSGAELRPFYTAIIMDLVRLAEFSSASDRSGANLAQATGEITMAGEFAGRMRAAGAAGFGRGAFESDVFQRFFVLDSQHLAFLDNAAAHLPEGFNRQLTEIREGAIGQQLQAFRDQAMQAHIQSAPFDAAGPAWFAASTAYINALNELRDAIFAEEARLTTAEGAAIYRRAYTETAIVVIGVLLMSVFAISRVRRIIGELIKLTRGLQRLARGATDVWVTGMGRKDIIGLVARSVQNIVRLGALNTQIRRALDVSDAMIMIADAEKRIIYVNGSLERSVDESIEYFMTQLDDFDPFVAYDHMFGLVRTGMTERGIDIDAITGREEIEARLDTRLFDVSINPVIDTDGVRVGTAVEWREVTDTRAIEHQLADMIKATQAGDFTRQFEVEGSQQFLRDIASGLNTINTQVNGFLQELKSVLAALAEGDLTRRVSGAYAGDLATLSTYTNTTIDQLNTMVQTMAMGSEKIRGASTEINDGARMLSNRASDTAAALEETAGAMEEISTNVSSTAESATAANTAAQTARESAGRGSEVVSSAVDAMQMIQESSKKISDIVSVIDEISFQTNLLALNAAVEAARAGEAGKGFSVVAAEVRALAQRSSEAAQDIKRLIVDSAANVNNGVAMVEATGTALTEIVDGIVVSTDRIAEISDTMREVSTSVRAISDAISKLDSNTQADAQAAVQNSSHAQKLTQDALELATLVSRFRTEEGADGGAISSAA